VTVYDFYPGKLSTFSFAYPTNLGLPAILTVGPPSPSSSSSSSFYFYFSSSSLECIY
jgi:hypothetical protein